MSMIWLGILLIELLVLFILSNALTDSIFGLILLITKSRTVAVSLTTAILFPGTVVHELSHLFTAEILGVRTGKLTLVPNQISKEHIQSGSVMIAQSDPFRRYMIGLAPVLGGILSLTALSYLLPTFTPHLQFENLMKLVSNPYTYYILLATYFLFAISNSMFSSPEDLKGFGGFLFVIALFCGGAYMVGLRLTVTGAVLEIILRILKLLTQNLGIVIGINFVIFFLAKISISLSEKIFKRKLIYK